MTNASVWRPGAAFSEQGALQAVCERPSSVTVAPPGLLTTITGYVVRGATGTLAGFVSTGWSAGGTGCGSEDGGTGLGLSFAAGCASGDGGAGAVCVGSGAGAVCSGGG